MTTVEKLLALKVTPPFDRLRDNELALIASAAVERRFEPGQMIHQGGGPFDRFHLLVSGGWTSPGGPLPRTLGVGSLLYDLAALAPVVAGDTGAVCLIIARSHFHTIVTECPELLLGYLTEDSDQPRAS